MTGDLSSRWQDWALAMVPILHIMCKFLVGRAVAIQMETDPSLKGLIFRYELVKVYAFSMTGDLSTRWQYWAFAMVPILHILCNLLVGLAGRPRWRRTRA